MNASIMIIGIGNAYRRDDGVGLVVARNVEKKRIAGVIVQEASGEGTALMEAWCGMRNVFLIDAVQSGGRPGEIHRFDTRTTRMPSKFFHYSTHAFSVAEAVELARTMNRLPRKLVVYGIEGRNFDAGEELSPEVEEAGQKVVARVISEIQEMRPSHA